MASLLHYREPGRPDEIGPARLPERGATFQRLLQRARAQGLGDAELVARVGLLDAAGVHFEDNAFGLAVLDGRNPFGIEDTASMEQYMSVLFHERSARPPLPWPGAIAFVRHRRNEAAFEQAVLDRIGRGDERFLPGDEAGHIRQPALLLWCRQDAVIDPSALDLYAARIPQARRVLLDGCGHMSLMERPHAVAEAVVEWMHAQ